MIILASPDSVNVVPITKTGEIVFVRQYRFGTRSYTLELPGGIVDPGEDHGVAARRELQEETGFTSSSWEYLGKIGSNPVFMDSYVHHWLARDVELTHEVTLDAGEDVEMGENPGARGTAKATERGIRASACRQRAASVLWTTAPLAGGA